ncbi:MAG: anti-sigma factor domain-containing protein [Planctomycetia bacterium]
MKQEKHDVQNSTSHGASGRERLLELLADRAVFGLDAAEETELAGLLADHSAVDVDGLDRLAATVAVATGRTAEPLPAGLKPRLEADVQRYLSGPVGVRSGRSLRVAAAALLATAVGLLVLVGRREPEPQRQPVPAAPAPVVAATPTVQRDELLATVSDAVRLDCAAADGEVEQGAASGDVIWSPSRQRGFLRIGGLSANDPAESRYQVWIIDGDRGTPVPGGLFDVTAAGDVVVPILPRGFVQGPTMFAITREPATGSRDAMFDRERVVVRAE